MHHQHGVSELELKATKPHFFKAADFGRIRDSGSPDHENFSTPFNAILQFLHLR